MHSYPTYNSVHWQRRAQEFRQLAISIEGADAKTSMIRIAEHYDRLAASTSERASAETVLAGALNLRPAYTRGWPV